MEPGQSSRIREGAVAGLNWLPAPKGAFILMMRLYWPNPTPPSIQNKSWVPPPVTMMR